MTLFSRSRSGLLLFALWLLACCSGGATYVRSGFTQGTAYRIIAVGGDTVGFGAELETILAEADSSMSIYNPASLLSLLNANSTDSTDLHIRTCLAVAQKVSAQSGGVYDVTVMPLTEAWGFAARGQAAEPNVDSLLQFVGYEKISVQNGRLAKTDPRVRIDLNSIAKGYTADLVAGALNRRRVKNYMVEIGGEMVLRGKNPEGQLWQVGIDRPSDAKSMPGRELQAVLGITDKALATSGNYRRYHTDARGNRVGHTLDPRTGRTAVTDLLSVTIVAARCVEADAYATMMMVLGVEKSLEFLAQHPEIAAYLIYGDDSGGMRTFVSPQLEKHIVRPN